MERSEEVALKILTNRNLDQFIRFKDEIKLGRRLQGRPGILPLLDAHVPTEDDKWHCFSMPIGTPLMTFIGAAAGIYDRIEPLARIADCLVDLHAEDITHADVKMAHVYRVGNDWVLGDFGVSEWPGRTDPQDPHPAARIPGLPVRPTPAHLRAPIRKYNDVASIGCLLMSLIHHMRPHDPDEYPGGRYRLSLRAYVKHPELLPLDELIVLATDHDPYLRCTMPYFAARLHEWMANFAYLKPAAAASEC
jgi:serine/threonine-protein kinase